MNKNNLITQKELFTATEYESLVEIMAFLTGTNSRNLKH